MKRLELPALRSDDTLGFLAALGLLELCEHGLGIETRLGWAGLGGSALMESPFSRVPELSEALTSVAHAWRREERLVATSDQVIKAPLGAKARQQLESPGALDPMRMPAAEAVQRFASQQRAELERATAADARWLCALVGQLSPAKRGEADRRLTPLYSPSGQMTLHQLYRDARDDVCKRPAALAEALNGWRRYPGTGANLDSRALVDAAESSAGKAANRAVPGATWLALQALPFFVQTGDGRRGEVTAWRRTGGRGALVLRWPVWTVQLDAASVRVLLAHPALHEVSSKSQDAAAMKALGVCAVLTSRRKSLAKSAGPLQPPLVEWPT